MKLKPDQRQPLNEAIIWFKSNHLIDKYRLVNDRLAIASPVPDLQRLYSDTDNLVHIFQSWPVSQLLEFDDSLAPCLKRALLSYRLYHARFLDSFKTHTTNPEILKSLEDRLTPLDSLLHDPNFVSVQPLPMPRLVDLVTVQTIENGANATQLIEREYDEKFHILQAPRLFLEDLKYYRTACSQRGTNVIAVYLDIDDFKKFNTAHGETEIDRRVLPQFMQALESHVFQHGFAYRYGGDEYVMLLPSLSREIAIYFLDALRASVAEIQYQGVDNRTTISVGFCCVDPDTYQTDREVEHLANKAKNFAKANGKNCIATYVGHYLEEGELRVVTPGFVFG